MTGWRASRWSGRATSGCRSRCAASRLGFPVVGYDIADARIEHLRPARSYVEDVSRRAARAALARGLPPDHGSGRPARLRRRGHHRADAAARRRPRPLVHRGRRARSRRRACAPARSSCSSRRRTRARPKSCCGRSSSESGLRAGDRLLPRLLARAHRPRQRAVDVREHAEGRVGHRRRRRSRRSRRSTARSSTRSCPVGRTGEAELVKLLENTFRHVNIALVNELAMFARDLGVDIWSRDRRRGDEAVRLHALHARPRRRRPLPADRSVVPRVARRTATRPALPLRRARQRRQRRHARLRRRAASQSLLNDQAALGQGIAHPAARPRVQGRSPPTGASRRRWMIAERAPRARRRRPRARPARARRRGVRSADHTRCLQ